MGNYLSTSNKESMQVINEPDHVRVIMSTSEEQQENQENQENQEDDKNKKIKKIKILIQFQKKLN